MHDDKDLKILNSHFKAVRREPYTEAYVRSTVDVYLRRFIGEKTKISKRNKQRIIQALLKDIRAHYGKWVNLLHFDLKNLGFTFKCEFNSNIDYVYKTNKGTLYASYRPGVDGFYFTTHALERLEERMSGPTFKSMQDYIQENLACAGPPTALDIALGLIAGVTQLGVDNKKENILYAACFAQVEDSIVKGTLVLEKVDDLFIVKSYLSGYMIKSLDASWRDLEEFGTDFCKTAGSMRKLLLGMRDYHHFLMAEFSDVDFTKPEEVVTMSKEQKQQLREKAISIIDGYAEKNYLGDLET